uniref:Gasdermin-D-like isoform X1 n=1 Tax=Pogona vitticeps TaxID=103695 RepID=A0ABM5GRN0_9SAUR
MFKRLAKQLTQELDPDGTLIPMTSLAHNDSFQPLSLVTKEPFRLFGHSRKYSPTSFKLADILQEETTLEIGLKHAEPLLFCAHSCHKSGARLKFKVQSTQVDISGLGSACTSASPAHVRKTYVDTKELWAIEISHNIIQQLSPKLDFYIVTEVFEIMESLLVEEIMQGGGKGEVTVRDIFTIQGLNKRIKQKSLLIPQGTIMAYRVEKLQSHEEEPGCSLQSKQDPFLTYDAFQDELGSSLTAIQKVKDVVKEAYEPLMRLSQPLKRHLLKSFRIFLEDSDVASTVQSVLELSMVGDDVDHSVLEPLNEELRPKVEKFLSHLGIFKDTEKGESQDLWRPIHFFCSSIDDLDYEMLPLLEAIVEKNNMAKQLEMMDSVLKWILSGDEGSVFTISFQSMTDEEAGLTAEMLQMCELDLEVGKVSATCLWNNKAHSELGALYSSLYALQILRG